MVLKDAPFIYGTTVSSFGFTNREEEVDMLSKNLLTGINTILISPRRWGKSSLVEKVASEINRKHKQKVKTVLLDLFTVHSEQEFLELYAKEVIKASHTKFEEILKITSELFKHIIPKFNVSLESKTDFSLSFDVKDLKKYSDEILNLPEKLGKKKNIKFIICIDEFQNLTSFHDYEHFEKKLRAIWQRHKHATYCLYGSKRHLMTQLFDSSNRPFYRFGDVMLLQKITTTKWIPYITKQFLHTNKYIDKKDAELIATLMKNHPWYVQQLSHYTWKNTSKKATTASVYKALQELLQTNSPLYQLAVENLSASQINLLKAIAQEEEKLTSTHVMTNYKLGTPNNVTQNVEKLLLKDIIHKNGIYEFLDPAFEIWFKKIYLNVSPFPV